jgi:hypothetical protein
MADRDEVATSDEQVGFAESDSGLTKLGSAGNDEKTVAILLDLGPLMRLAGILDGKVVQTELSLDLSQERVARLQKADPHHMVGPPRPLAGLGNGDRRDPAPGDVDTRADDTRRIVQQSWSWHR